MSRVDPTGIVIPERRNPLEQLGNMLSLKDAVIGMRLKKQQLQDYEGARNIYRNAKTDADITSGLRQIGGKPLMDWTEHLAKMDLNQLQQTKEQAQVASAWLEQAAKSLESMESNDPETQSIVWPAHRAFLLKIGMPKELLPADYNMAQMQRGPLHSAQKHMERLSADIDKETKAKKLEFDKAAELRSQADEARKREDQEAQRIGGYDIKAGEEEWATAHNTRIDKLTPPERAEARKYAYEQKLQYTRTASKSNLHPDTMLYQGKPVDVLVDTDPDSKTAQHVFYRGQDITDQATHYEKPTGQPDARADASYRLESSRIDRISKPFEDRVNRLQAIKDSLDQNSPQADSLIAPELLTAMAGGIGSGLRMNEAEISRIIGGRNAWEDLKSRVLRWQADPTKPFLVTDEQRQQINKLLTTTTKRLKGKQAAIDAARQKIIDSKDPVEHRKATLELQRKLEIDSDTESTIDQEILDAIQGLK